MLPANRREGAEQIVQAGESRGVTLRLLGGLALKLLCPSTSEPRFFRENEDIDLLGRREDVRGIMKVLETLGYKSREVFDKLNMNQRLIYSDSANRRRVDIFLDEFAVGHKFDLRQSFCLGCILCRSPSSSWQSYRGSK